MTIQEMLSKMTPQMLAQGLKQISQGLTPEQLKQAENAIKESGVSNQMNQGDAGNLQNFLTNNPDQLKKLVQNKELVSKLEQIIKKK